MIATTLILILIVVLLPGLQHSLKKQDTVLNIVCMVYLGYHISETENQTEDNYLFITPRHLAWLSISVNWAWVFWCQRVEGVAHETQQWWCMVEWKRRMEKCWVVLLEHEE